MFQSLKIRWHQPRQVLALCLMAVIANLQAAGDPSVAPTPRPSDTRPELPDYQVPEITPEFALPPIPPSKEPETRLSGTPQVFVREIHLNGNTVFSDAELEAFAAPYENRVVAMEELQELRLALTQYYIDHGYINSGAVIPDQEVRNGVVEIRIVEGTLTGITINGTNRFNPDYIKRRLETGDGPPLNITELQEELQTLLQDPRIGAIHAELLPGEEPGQATLNAAVEERLPYLFDVTFDNQIAPSIGGKRVNFAGAHRNLSGWGDTLTGQLELAKGLLRMHGDYDIPLTARDTTLELWADYSNSRTVEEPFNIIDIESEYRAYGISLRHPLYRTSRRSLWMSATLERRRSLTFLLDIPFSFAPGVQNGLSEVTVLRFSQDWLSRSPTSVLAIRSSLSVGVDAFDPTINAAGPDGRFFTWLGQFQLAQRYKRGQFIFRTDLQVSADPLLPLEKFAAGGANSVRGYRENQLVRDRGFVSSIEYRHSLYNGERLGDIQIAPFVDVGGIWDVAAETPSPHVIAAAGIGLRWDPGAKLHAQLYWGHAFMHPEDPGGDVQDQGVHFAVQGSFFD